MRVIWHPYTDDSEEVKVDVTDWHPARICAVLAKAMPTYENIQRLSSAFDNQRPFHDPNLGCFLYAE